MPITLEDLTVDFGHADRAALLADWEWLIGPHRLPILITALGHAFVQDAGDGTVHQLDTVFGDSSRWRRARTSCARCSATGSS